jgi:hypothetical protein
VRLSIWFDLPDGWSSKHYYDTESIVKTLQGYIRVWWKSINDKTKDDKSFDVENLTEINCSLREYRHLRITRYYGNGRIEREGPEEIWDYIPPSPSEGINSLVELFKVICGEVKK